MTTINFTRIHEIFSLYRTELDALSKGVHDADSPQRLELDSALSKLDLPSDTASRYAMSQRLGNWKFEPLEVYLQGAGKSREEIDALFDASYLLTQHFVEGCQEAMLAQIEAESLLPDFYMTLLRGHHEVGKLCSALFLKWNRHIIFTQNRSLEEQFSGNKESILQYLKDENLLDTGHDGELADRSYSVLLQDASGYKRASYMSAFPEEVTMIIARLGVLILELDMLEDEVYDRKLQYISYYQDIVNAFAEEDCDSLVTRWAQVDTAWMAIDTPFQPGHPLEYYDDAYRKAVSIEWDMRIGNPEVMESSVKSDMQHMYEGFFDDIGRETFASAYSFSKNSTEQVQLHIGVPYLSYGGFLCGMYSAQVVPNDTKVSEKLGKKIFAFPSFILQSYRSAPKMRLDYETIDTALIDAHHNFLHGAEERFYQVYDISTIGHEFGHTLWLDTDTEIVMNQKTGQFKCVEEFKATAGGIVAYLLSGREYLREEVLVECLYRNIKFMRYREVEDVLPYYCECLISLDIFYNSGIISFEDGKIALHYTDELFESFKKTYIAVYTHQVHSYLHKKDAGEFLREYTDFIDGVYLPKEEALREWVEYYYQNYKEIGNEVYVENVKTD